MHGGRQRQNESEPQQRQLDETKTPGEEGKEDGHGSQGGGERERTKAARLDWRGGQSARCQLANWQPCRIEPRQRASEPVSSRVYSRMLVA